MCALHNDLRNSVDEKNAKLGIPGKDNQVFIIRIRNEHRELQDAAPIWRGEIEHLNTGKKAFLKALIEIIAFIQPILSEMGMQSINSRMGTWNWLTRSKKILSSALQLHRYGFEQKEKNKASRSTKDK